MDRLRVPSQVWPPMPWQATSTEATPFLTFAVPDAIDATAGGAAAAVCSV